MRQVCTLGLVLVLSVTFVVAFDTTSVESAHAEECRWDPEAGEIVCGGGEDPKEPGPDPAPPPDGKKRPQEKREVCSEQECPRDIWCGDDDVPMKFYERTVVYRTGRGWVPVPGPEGEWTFTGLTSCQPPPKQEPTAGEVWQAVREVGLEGAKPSIDPPNGRSLVNLKTNFYTTKTAIEPFSLPVGQAEVSIRATATSYTWNFGDGHSRTTTTPGDGYPNMEVTHTYEETGEYQPSVTITYTVEWKWGQRGWQDLDELEARNSPPADLQIFESRTALGDDVYN